ncbi:uncharacterized protein LOC101735738 isoform X3 [Bombyx mori]|uniref:Uncharacterized protein n=1 Tax=Bombyx mori TaxID=7091 RepID=A0A8R1WGU3_BOMMO|nr:uncharacterized protein LOC101735738 isoform X3 [Bombyx mori]
MRFAALIALFAIAIADELCSVDDLRQKLYALEDELWRNVSDPMWRQSDLGGDVELTKAFVALDELIQAVPRSRRPPLNSWIWTNAIEKMQIIDGHYKYFAEFARTQSRPGAVPAPVREWMDLTEAVLMDPKSSVTNSMKKLGELMSHGEAVTYRLVMLQEGGTDVCTLQMSPHQLIYDIYNTIALAEIKGYAIMQFSWMLLKLYGKGNFSQEASLTRERYGQRTTQAANVVRGVLSSASRDLYRCDPIQHEEGKTYDQVTRLLQGYIENEVDMNPQGTCQENCGYYTLTQRYGCYDDQLCTQQKTCGGRIINCQYIDSDMWVCPSGDSKRRYDWVTYENGRTLGQKGECTSGGHSTKVDSWWKWNLFHCSYCFCLCEDAVDISERFFSMREALAQISKNKVVTGLRLIKHGRVFHLQVYESTLKERGLIEGGDWVPVQKFDPLDPQFKDGVDYHTLTYENRAIDLDDLDSPSGHVLTGVRFRMLGAHLHFEIRSTPFNYTTGRLSPEKSQWISNDNTEGSARPRVKLELKNPDIPTRSSVPLAVDSEHDQYVEFTNSDLEADAAQSTVPFIDVQPVLPAGAGALASGAGVLHRGARGSGGFVALRLRTYPHARHVRAEPPADLPRGPDPADGPDFEPTVN